MANPLEDCTVEEQRPFFSFLVAEGIKPSEIISRLFTQYRKSSMTIFAGGFFTVYQKRAILTKILHLFQVSNYQKHAAVDGLLASIVDFVWMEV